jgi:glycerol kinase
MLFNIHTLRWDEELLGLFGVPEKILPEVRSSSGEFGMADADVLGAAVPIMGMAGDQQAALFGQGCFSPGFAKNTYGTGCFLLINSGDKPAVSTHKLLSTVAWRIGAETRYALEGSVFIGGAVVQWLRDGLGLIKTAAEIEPLAASVADSGGVYLVPAFAGLGAPHWDPYARGTIMGITRSTGAGHIARAAVESIAFQVADILEVMQADAGIAIKELRVDGGAAANDELLQFQADLLRVAVIRPQVTESTALGAAYLAGLAAGVFGSLEELAKLAQVDRVFEPVLGAAEAARRRARWRAALERCRDWAEHE